MNRNRWDVMEGMEDRFIAWILMTFLVIHLFRGLASPPHLYRIFFGWKR